MPDPVVDVATTEQVARGYFAALAAHDLEAAVGMWEPGGREIVRGQVDTVAPEGVRQFLGEIFAAFPDFAFTVEEVTTQDDRCAVRWSASGTFAGPSPFHGIEPTGAVIAVEGIDQVTVRDGKIVRNDAFMDGATIMRQLGALPPDGSKTEARMTGALNAKTRIARALGSGELEDVADGVWLLRGGIPGKTMNVYFVRDDEQPDGVLMFDAGVRSMANDVRRAAASLGGLTRVVLGHGHADHRGTSPFLDVPVFCHVDERDDAEGDGGAHYFRLDKLNPIGKLLLPRLLVSWDGGPVTIAGTLEEGDAIASGFRVVHLPGHAPGNIGLWREADGVALTSDAFYTLDPQTGLKGHGRVPHVAFNQDTEQARASIRKLADLAPSAAWPGHADGLTGDVREQLERVAATT
jgi:glyoxylase-like metal-dependent hydrolase (beta-lactamase superfamily II)/predicted ester cyclase